MKKNKKVQKQQNKLPKIAFATAIILAAVYLIMQLTGEVRWSSFDFIVAGALVFGTGFFYELITRSVKDRSQRFAVGMVLAILFVIIWVQLAVGIIN